MTEMPASAMRCWAPRPIPPAKKQDTPLPASQSTQEHGSGESGCSAHTFRMVLLVSSTSMRPT